MSKDTPTKSCTEDADNMVGKHYRSVKGKIYKTKFNTLNAQYMLRYMYVGPLKRGCALNIDVICAEHLLLAKDSKVTDCLVTLFSLCIKYRFAQPISCFKLLDQYSYYYLRHVVWRFIKLDRCGEYESHDH